jgi:hypothetical protein
MKKFLFIVILLASVMALAQPYPIRLPEGGICDSGAVAAGTLLIPYFEVSSSDPAGLDTLVGIINVQDYPIVAHVVGWNVDSWSVFDFNIYLTPYDVVTFSMRQILINGNLPNNFCGGDPDYRFIDGTIDCDGDGMYYLDGTTNDSLFSLGSYAMDMACYGVIDNATLSEWQCKLSIGSYDGPTDNYVGYLTIDTVITCNGGLPDSVEDYFNPNYLDTEPIALPDGIADHSVLENTNALLGDFFYYDNTNMVGDGYPAVHIEVWGEDNLATGHFWGMHQIDNINGVIQTFWNKYEIFALNPLGPFADHRETLPLRWGFRYIGNAAFDGGTWVDAWRSGNPRFSGWFASGGPCDFVASNPGGEYTVLYDYIHGSFPDNMGLHTPPLVIYDEDEETTGGTGGPSPPPVTPGLNVLKLETQRVDVADWPLVATDGWIGIAFDTDFLFDWFPYCVTNICSFDQSWLNVRYSALNKYTAGLSGVSYKGGCWMDAVTGTVPVQMVLSPSH